MWKDLTSYLPNDLLVKSDRVCMFNGIENRSPFLDNRLFKWTTKIPTKYLIRNSFAKSILRDSVSGIAPEKILKNPRKVGFNVPIDDYINFNNKKNISMLYKSSIMDEVVHFDLIKDILKNKKRSNEESKFIFNYLSARLFLENFT